VIVVKRHKGHSGVSVYEWRVYRVFTQGAKTRQVQLMKSKSEEAARNYAAQLEKRDRECVQ